MYLRSSPAVLSVSIEIMSPLLQHIGGYVAGHWVTRGDTGKTLPVINPASGERLAEIPVMSGDQTVSAIEAASAAMRCDASMEQRSQWLSSIHGRLLENREELARIITLEQGKPLKESRVEVEYSAAFFSFFASQLSHLSARSLPEPIKNLRWSVHHRPAGVVGLITPWNFPLAMLAKKLAPAIGAGCAVIAKPAELTPLTAIALWHLLDGLALPPGRFNLVMGEPAPIGEPLCAHPAVRLISFTGSTATGRKLIENSAPHVKRLSLELGGNAPFIVMEDADLDGAADALMANKFRCAGQTCVCANRVLVHQPVADSFAEIVARRVRALRVGPGIAPETDIGPLINRAACEKVDRHVTDAIARGARRIVPAELPAPWADNAGCFYPPTVLQGATRDMLLSKEETFGPVVAISLFGAEEEAVSLANGTPFGLAAYVFTRDQDRADRIAAKLHFGHVGLNTGMGPTPEAPFGGMKQSGFGREGGIEGLLEFCEAQTVVRP